MGETDTSPDDTERWNGEHYFVVTAGSPHGGKIAEVLVKADSEQEATQKCADWVLYEVKVRTESGGYAWESVLAPSEEKAREDAFDRDIRYLETLDIEEYRHECEIRARPESGDNRSVRADTEQEQA